MGNLGEVEAVDCTYSTVVNICSALLLMMYCIFICKQCNPAQTGYNSVIPEEQARINPEAVCVSVGHPSSPRTSP